MKVFIITFVLVLIDQISKIAVKGFSIPFLGIYHKGMDKFSSINIIGDFFKLTFIENPGMAFGIEIGGKLFLSLFTVFATILIIYFIIKNRNQNLYLRISLAFILGGAVGNMIDRLFYGVIYGEAPLFFGKVVDFFQINIPNFSIFGKTFYSWPIFNLADIWVTAGFIMILIGYKRIHTKEASLTGGSAINETSDNFSPSATTIPENSVSHSEKETKQS